MKKFIFGVLVLLLIGGFVVIIQKKPTASYNPKHTTIAIDKTTDTIIESEPEPDMVDDKISRRDENDTTINQETIEEEEEKLFYKSYINNLKVNFRKSPTLTSEIIETLPIGTKIHILTEEGIEGETVNTLKPGTWNRVLVDGKIGYIYDSCISTITTTLETYSPTIGTLNSPAYVFSESNLQSKILDTLSKNLRVLLTQRTTEQTYVNKAGYGYWYKMESCRVDGWVFSTTLNF